MAEHGLKCIEPKFVSISCAQNYLAGLGYASRYLAYINNKLLNYNISLISCIYIQSGLK